MPLYTTAGKPGNRELSICSRRIKIQKHRKTKVLTGVKLIILRGKFAVAVQRFKIIRPRFDGVGQPDP